MVYLFQFKKKSQWKKKGLETQLYNYCICVFFFLGGERNELVTFYLAASV